MGTGLQVSAQSENSVTMSGTGYLKDQHGGSGNEPPVRKWFPDIDVGQCSICYRVFNDPPFEIVCENCPTSKTLRDGLVYETIRKTQQAKGTCDYRIVASPIFSASGEVTAAVVMVEDITEKLSLESQLIPSPEDGINWPIERWRSPRFQQYAECHPWLWANDCRNNPTRQSVT